VHHIPTHHRYTDEIVNHFGQINAKDVQPPTETGTSLTKAQCPSTFEEIAELQLGHFTMLLS
jgi:hypothetical protein